nr:hypothetical protein [Anaerolineae bacterium]
SLLVLRFVAVSSLLLAATLMLFSVWQNGVGAPLTLAAMMATVLVGYTHRSNWERMRRGVEGRAFAADPGETLDG